ncbi:8338_t:CDS:2 [Acaulospora morrowiae]|uniref:8338_t:CDS:1 n=1 Tax=Acaulospora morrowiae TaxID=94023 RepID=A0A9N8V8T0_9GLOM|nr:8338_t:CDS:2 [Acaulospora morrowiae]
MLATFRSVQSPVKLCVVPEALNTSGEKGTREEWSNSLYTQINYEVKLKVDGPEGKTGELETVHEDVRGKEIGTLQLGEDGIPIIRVGHWTIAGQIIELERPIMVIKRRQTKSERTTASYNDITPDDTESNNVHFDFRSESSMLAENFQRSVGMISGSSKDLEAEDSDDNNLTESEISKPRVSLHRPKVSSENGQNGRTSDKEENLNVEYDAVQVFRKIYLFRNRPIPVRYGY